VERVADLLRKGHPWFVGGRRHAAVRDVRIRRGEPLDERAAAEGLRLVHGEMKRVPLGREIYEDRLEVTERGVVQRGDEQLHRRSPRLSIMTGPIVPRRYRHWRQRWRRCLR